LPGLNGGGAAAAVPQGAIENSTRRNAFIGTLYIYLRIITTLL